MTLRRDWFKRHVEIMAQAIGIALGLKKKGEIQDAVANVETAVQKAFGLSPKLALGLPLEDFLKLALRGEKPSPELRAQLVEVFRQWAELLEEQGRAEAQLARARCRELEALAP